MKKVLNLIVFMFLLVFVMGCDFNNGETKEQYNVIVPTGAPSIAVADFIKNKDENVNVEIVNGADLLGKAFLQGEYDVIVAPVNLGLKFYNSNDSFDYEFYKPIVGCNFYILSSTITEFNELNNHEIVAFNESATPGVMLKTLAKYYNVTLDAKYESSVNAANTKLVGGVADTILTAEPAKTVISKGKDYNVIDLSELWKNMAGNDYAVPQAGIFVKKGLDNDYGVKKILNQMKESVKLARTNPTKLAEEAILVDPNLSKQTVENLSIAIPNCNFIEKELNKEEVEFYFQKVIELGLGASLGGKLPDEEFYR